MPRNMLKLVVGFIFYCVTRSVPILSHFNMENHTCANPSCKSNDASKKCSKCYITFYCSKDCQVAHWKIHKKTNCKAYKCIEVEGKGLGMVATRDISYGELIIQEKAIITIQGFQSEKEILEKFDKLSVQNKNNVMSLHDIQSPKTPVGVYKTNSLQAGGGSSNSVLCYEISRFNHSCLPNVSHAFAEPYERIYAIRDIKKGIELCTAYICPWLTTSERQEDLQKKFDFICACPVCLLPTEEQAERDYKLRKYSSLDGRIGFVNPYNAQQGLSLVQEALDILTEVDLISPAYIGRHCYDGFQLACMLGNERKAKGWIKRAYEARLIENGPHEAHVKNCRVYLHNPKSHRAWMSR